MGTVRVSALAVVAELPQVEPESILRVSRLLEALLQEGFDAFLRGWSLDGGHAVRLDRRFWQQPGRRKLMASFDYDVVIIGSGFGGSVAALRAAEKGYRVGVMESGRRWKDEDIPKTQWDLPHFLWMPAAELYGIQRIEPLDDVLVLSGAGVGGGSHVYANTLYVPPEQFFDAPEWADITDWADELAPCIDQATRMLGVVRYPYVPTDVDRVLQQVAIEMGRGETFNKAPVGVYFGSPGVEADDPYFGGVGPRRTGCISCVNCNIGCGHNAKNKLTTNYLYLAEKLGVKIHELNEVYDIAALPAGGFEVHARHPGWAQRSADLHHHAYTAEQVIVAAHAYGSAKLLHHMQHKGRLTGLSSQFGQRARTNSEQLLAVTRTHGEWERDPERIRLTPGSVSITSGVWPDPQASIEPTIWGVGSDVFAFLVTHYQHGEQKHATASWLKEFVGHPGQVLGLSDPRHWSERSFIACARRRPTPRSSCTCMTACCAADRPAHLPRCTFPPARRSSIGWPRRWEAARGRFCSRSSTATRPRTSTAGSRSARTATAAPSTRTSACSANRDSTSLTEA
jgi:cholesterol oxidase